MRDSYHLKLIHILIFSLLLAASFVLLESANRFLLLKSAPAFLMIDALTKNKDGIEVLFLGDSHFKLSIGASSAYNNPQKKVFDLLVNGANYIQSYYLLKRHIDILPNLRAIVLPLDLHSFSSFRSHRIEFRYFFDAYMDYAELTAIDKTFRLITPFHFTIL